MADRRELKQRSKNDLVDEVLRLQRILDVQLGAGPGLSGTLSVQGVVLAGTEEPAVQWRCGEAAGQWSTLIEAVNFGRAVITAAVEAERDAATIAFLRTAEFDESHIGPFLAAMREHRIQFAGGLAEEASAGPKDGGR